MMTGVGMLKWNLRVCCATALLGASWAVFAQNIGCYGSATNGADCLRPNELPITQANSAPGKFTSRIIFLADQLERNVDNKLANTSYLIGSFVDLNEMGKSSPMGQNFMINEGGEFVLSRDVKQLRDRFGVTGVVAGTYVVSGDYTVVNARVVNIESGMVMSSGQIHIPSNWFANALMSPPSSRPLKIIGAP